MKNTGQHALSVIFKPLFIDRLGQLPDSSQADLGIKPLTRGFTDDCSTELLVVGDF